MDAVTHMFTDLPMDNQKLTQSMGKEYLLMCYSASGVTSSMHAFFDRNDGRLLEHAKFMRRAMRYHNTNRGLPDQRNCMIHVNPNVNVKFLLAISI